MARERPLAALVQRFVRDELGDSAEALPGMSTSCASADPHAGHQPRGAESIVNRPVQHCPTSRAVAYTCPTETAPA